MKKTYKCSNVKFCMEDENQRRTWEYLQGITRKEGSYGKILSDAFVAVLDVQIQAGTDKATDGILFSLIQDKAVFEEIVERALDQKFQEMLQELRKVITEQISSSFSECTSDFHSDAENFMKKADADGMGQMQETELSEDMMKFAFAMGE